MEKTKRSTLLGWGVGDFGFQLMILVSVNFFSAFLTDYAMFPVALAGVIMTLTGVGDAITQPFSGVLVTKSNMKWGKYRSWYIVGPPIVFLTFILGFTRIGSDMMAAFIIIASYVACRFTFNCIWAAHLALIPYVGKTPEERGFLSASRGIWQTAGALIFSAISLSLMEFLTNTFGRIVGVTIMAGIFGLCMVAGYLVAFYATKDVQQPVDTPVTRKKTDAKSFVMAIVKNPPLLWLILAEVCRNLGTFTFTTMCFYYFKYTTDRFMMYAVFMSISNLVKLGGATVTSYLCGKWGGKATYVIGTFGNALFYILAFFFKGSVMSFIVFASLGMLFAALPTGATSLMFGQCGQYSQWKTGVDNRAFVTGLIGFPVKIASFTKGAIFSAIMLSCGFVANAEVVSEATAAGIRSGTLLVPAAIFVVNGVLALLCGLNKSTVNQMEADLAAAEKAQ